MSREARVMRGTRGFVPQGVLEVLGTRSRPPIRLVKPSSKRMSFSMPMRMVQFSSCICASNAPQDAKRPHVIAHLSDDSTVQVSGTSYEHRLRRKTLSQLPSHRPSRILRLLDSKEPADVMARVQWSRALAVDLDNGEIRR